MKQLIEKEFFNCSFKEIKKREWFKDLNLTDEEIIDCRNDIKEILKIEDECNVNSNFCSGYKKHFKLLRNKENNIEKVFFICKKKKNFLNFLKKNFPIYLSDI